jgi:hypothetical protein
MSITAILLQKCCERRPALAAQYGQPVIDQHIYHYAARLIAGTYTN